MVLTKAEISDYLFKKLTLNKQEVKDLVDIFFEEVRKSLEIGEEVKLSGFGNFCLRNKKQRLGRNPKTGECVAITARRVVVFKAGQKLRSRIESLQNIHLKKKIVI
ncbi:integration host factor subunit alpha [Buchnera aphidicola]|uniref:Integration host factor subunit alpha n=1 Tax=Buchnera aphidicola (Cinara laricifoliae) TaxID=2518977 RepID=A0A451DB10_9GAMM|nr:integration host factor subunit alpha [Buchnera aphidicola]VFP83564.1 Integration host factor subunit alpha [Buchnera aphidicola (Cinara laricifoliae)]